MRSRHTHRSRRFRRFLVDPLPAAGTSSMPGPIKHVGGKIMYRMKCCRAALAPLFGLLLAAGAPAASAQDTLKLAVGQRGNWDTSVSELGQRAGIFKKYGIVLDILYTQGGGETQQAVLSGSVEVGVA